MKYMSFFEPFLKEGKDILYICLTRSLSNTYESSLLAIRELGETYPDRKMISMDSLCASGGEGILAVEAGRNRENGMSLEDNHEWLKRNTLRLSHFFTVGDLSYLKRGGRISPTTAVIGNALNIKPILYVDNDGKLSLLTTAHGRKASIRKLIRLTQETAEDPQDQTFYVLHADCPEEAENLKEMILKEFGCRDVVISRVGPVIGTHVGPEMIAMLAFGSGRKPQK